MDDCKFCILKPIILAETPVYQCGDSTPVLKNPYKSLTLIPSQPARPFHSDARFTPRARLTLTEAEAAAALRHRAAWRLFLNNPANHAFIADEPSEQLARQATATNLPKDWDIVMLTPTQYIMTRRAAATALESSIQFHDPIPKFLTTLPFIKVVDLK
jgi:hypothetical protein